MVYQIVSQIQNGEEIPINSKGCEDIEIGDLFNEVDNFSYDDSDLRLIALHKRGIFRLTKKSYKQLKRELTRRGILWRFNYEKR